MVRHQQTALIYLGNKRKLFVTAKNVISTYIFAIGN